MWVTVIITLSSFFFLSLTSFYLTMVRCRGVIAFDHTQWHTTVGRTPLDEGLARRRGFYLTTHTTLKYQCPRRDSNLQSQQAIGRRLSPLLLCVKLNTEFFCCFENQFIKLFGWLINKSKWLVAEYLRFPSKLIQYITPSNVTKLLYCNWPAPWHFSVSFVSVQSSVRWTTATVRSKIM